MSCPVPRLEMAVKGRTDFVALLLKAAFGTADNQDVDISTLPPAPELAAQQIVAFVERQRARNNRQARKK